MRRLFQFARNGLHRLDGYFQAAVRPDEPVPLDRMPMPWLSALLSALLVGAGQIHNRQLVKALVAFVVFFGLAIVGTAVLGLVYWSQSWTDAEWWTTISDRILALRFSLLAILACLWLAGIIDAYRTARALRSGDLSIRYGYKKQSVFAIAQWLPYVGTLIPAETVGRDESFQPTTIDTVRGAVGKKLWKRVKRWTGLGLVAWLGIAAIVVATLLGWVWLHILGGLIVGVCWSRIIF